MRSPRSLVVVLGIATGAFGIFVVGTTGGASAAVSYRALSTATAVTAQVSNPDQFPLGATLEGSGQTAQAVIDQIGTSTGFASFPYPGQFVLGVPGLVAGAGGPSLPVDYPLYVSSDPLHPKAQADGPGYSLRASSATGATTADATGGAAYGDTFASGRGTAHASSEVTATHDVVAEASTVVDSITVTGVLHIGRVSSSVTVTRSATGALRRMSHLDVEGASVGGQAISISDGEVVVTGTRQPLPDSPAGDLLATAGVTVAITEPVDDPDGRTGGAIVITVVNTNDAAGTSKAIYRLGGAAAFVSFSSINDGPPAVIETEDGGPAPAPVAQPAAPVSPGDAFDAPAPATPDVAGAAPGPPAVAFPAPASARVPLRGDAAWLYFCFVACSAALVLSTQLLSRYGVKARL
ncbi:MAG: hypothetical protein M3P04_00175 [Actinomycetota bacterium]|nr:hypothetical protein [Actinomycetota bacterium]